MERTIIEAILIISIFTLTEIIGRQFISKAFDKWKVVNRAKYSIGMGISQSIIFHALYLTGKLTGWFKIDWKILNLPLTSIAIGILVFWFWNMVTYYENEEEENHK